MHLPVLVDPADLVLSVEDAKAHLYVDHSDDDEIIEAFIEAATAHVERVTGYVLGLQTWQQDFDDFSSILRLPIGPVSEIDSVTYRTEAGVETPVDEANYEQLADPLSSYVRFKDDYSLPSDLYEVGAVRVTWIAGQEVVPPPLIASIKLILGDLYQYREAKIDGSIIENPTVKALLSTYRIY